MSVMSASTDTFLSGALIILLWTFRKDTQGYVTVPHYHNVRKSDCRLFSADRLINKLVSGTSRRRNIHR